MADLKRRTFLKRAAVMTASTILAACTPKNITQAPKPTATVARKPVQPTPTRQPAKTAQPVVAPPTTTLPPLAMLVAHRLQFGPQPDDLQMFESTGATDEERLQAYLDAQLNPDSIPDDAFEARYQAAKFETLGKSLEELARDHIVNNPYSDGDDRHWEWYIKPVEELVDATFIRAAYSRRQLFEMLVDFWHNHFNVYGWQDDVAPLLASYDRDVIRKHALGNFRQFLEAVAGHPSMLYYLNNRTNSDAGPNENFARELFELYTLGAENYLGVRDPQTIQRNRQDVAIGYVDNDVYEAARCFTGWRVDDDLWDGEDEIGNSLTFRYFRPWHDRYNKLVLGRYLPADQADLKDGRDVLDLLAGHPGTAHFVAGKLCRRLVADQPPEALVERAARLFLQQRDAPDQIAQVVRLIVSAPEFRAAWQAKVKRPFELAVAAIHALQANFTRLPGGVRWTYEMMGQPLFGHRPPNGYPDTAEHWANTMVALYAWNLTTGLANNWWSDEKDGINLNVNSGDFALGGLETAEGLVDAWLARLQMFAFPAESRQAVIDFLDGGGSAEERQNRLPSAVTLILMSPQFRFR